jgi:RNA polymerase sigma factor (sigma-70 family)
MTVPNAQLLFRAARALAPQAAGVPDADLVRRAFRGGDGAAFELLLWRHGGMVWGVCRRLLGHTHDAEDAFQATFLALARKGSSIGDGNAVAAWLHRVAVRAALAARARRSRRGEIERLTAFPPDVADDSDPPRDAAGRDLRRLLDEEIGRLPTRYRLAFILCELQGRSRAAAADELNCAVGTVESRLSRARGLLRRRLARRGLGLPAVLVIHAVPASLRATALARVAPESIAPAAVAALAAQALRGPLPWARLAAAAALLAACVGVATLRTVAGGPDPVTPAAPVTPPAPGDPARNGEPLPQEAVARVGSPRLRHADQIQDVVFSPDSRLIASVGRDGFIRVWDAATGAARHRFPILAGEQAVLAFAADGKSLLFAGPMPPDPVKVFTPVALRRFDLATGKEDAIPLPGNKAVAYGPAFAPDGSAFGFTADNQEYHVVAVPSGKLIRTVKMGAPGAVAVMTAGGTRVAFPPNQPGAAMTVHDVAAGKELPQIKDGARSIVAAAFSPDGRSIATVAHDPGNWVDTIGVWDTATGQLRRRIEGVENTASCVAFAPDGKSVAVGNLQRLAVQVFDVETGKPAGHYRSWPSVKHVVFAPDGRSLAAGRTTATISVWDLKAGKPTPASADPDGGVFAMRFTAGDRLLTVADDVSLHDWRTGKVVERLPDPRERPFGGYSLSPDLRLAVDSEPKGTIRLMNARTGEIVRLLKGHTSLAETTLFSADGKRLFSRGHDGTVRAWEVATGKELLKLTADTPRSGDRLALSADGRLLACSHAGGDGRVVHVWDAATGRELHRLTPPKGHVGNLEFAPDGRLLACATGEWWGNPPPPGQVVLWDTATGRERHVLECGEGAAHSLTFSPDGRTLATGGHDKLVRLWETASGQERHAFRGHEGPVYALAFSADGRRLASASPEAPVFIWDVYGGKQAPLPEGDANRLWAALASDNSAAAFAAVRKLAADPERAAALLREHLQPAPPLDEARLRRLLADLDADRFPVRKQAAVELTKLAPDVEAALRRAWEGAASDEVRTSLGKILATLAVPTGANLRERRSLEAREQAGSPSAVELLETLAKGAPSARLTDEAAAALKRLRQSE